MMIKQVDHNADVTSSQTARYAHRLPLTNITVVFFIEVVDDENRTRYETPYHDVATSITAEPVLVTTVE